MTGPNIYYTLFPDLRYRLSPRFSMRMRLLGKLFPYTETVLGMY